MQVLGAPGFILIIVELDKVSSPALPSVIKKFNIGAGCNVGRAAELGERPSLHDDRVLQGDGLIKIVVYHSGDLVTSGITWNLSAF